MHGSIVKCGLYQRDMPSLVSVKDNKLSMPKEQLRLHCTIAGILTYTDKF